MDAVCEKGKIVRLFEVEDSGFQVLKNMRGMEQAQKELNKKGFSVKKCMLGSSEDWKNVCGEMKSQLSFQPGRRF